MCRFNRFNGFSRFVKHKIEPFEFIDNKAVGESLTDDSFYVPNKEAVRRIKSINAFSAIKGLYDSKDDISRGIVDFWSRQKGRDLAELSQSIQRQDKLVNEQLQKDFDLAVAKNKAALAQPDKSQVSTTLEPVNN